MANANGQSAALPPAMHPPQLQRPPTPKTPVPPAAKTLPPRPAGTPASRPPPLPGDRRRSSGPPLPSYRLGPEESGSIIKDVDLREEDADDRVRVAVEAALAPLRERVDELERTMLETIVRLAKTPTSLADDGAPDARQADERRRRQVKIVIAGAIALGLAILFGMLASCR
jgi:hypothetical protein